MLKITFKDTYPKRDGTTGFLYNVTGEQKELDAYVAAKVAQGMPEAKIKSDKGIIWYSSEYKGESAPLEISAKGNYYPVTKDFDIMISTQRQIQQKKTQVEVTA